MTDIEPVLQRLGLQQYLDVFIAEGFDTWATLSDIQESDLEHLNFKLGHRRRLQRAIAEWRGWGSDKPLGSPSIDGTGPESQHVDGLSQDPGVGREQPASVPTEQKRKYRRHPKPDENAPEKPPSAYVLFSNKVREEVKSENLSFTDIARLVGERWQRLDPAQKDRFESHASALKETYNLQLGEYKKTDEYKEYSQYLVDFKAKHSQNTEQKSERKRPKLESYQSSSVSIPSPVMGDSTVPLTGQAHRYPTGLPGTVTYSGQGVVLATTQSQGAALPHLNTPMMHRPSPPHLLSSHSSMSEESTSTRAEHSDTLSRSASLSITTTSIETLPPLMIPGHRTGWPEYTQSLAYDPISARRPAQTYGPPTLSGTSPVSTKTSIPASGGDGEWRERSQAATRQLFSGSITPGSMAISQLVASAQDEEKISTSMASRRALPLPRQASGSAGQVSYMSSGLLTSPSHTHHSSPPLTLARERQSQERAGRSENQGINELDGIRERRAGAYHSWAPPLRPDGP